MSTGSRSTSTCRGRDLADARQPITLALLLMLAIRCWYFSGGSWRVISVSMKPGATALTRMPCGASSFAVSRPPDRHLLRAGASDDGRCRARGRRDHPVEREALVALAVLPLRAAPLALWRAEEVARAEVALDGKHSREPVRRPLHRLGFSSLPDLTDAFLLQLQDRLAFGGWLRRR